MLSAESVARLEAIVRLRAVSSAKEARPLAVEQQEVSEVIGRANRGRISPEKARGAGQSHRHLAWREVILFIERSLDRFTRHPGHICCRKTNRAGGTGFCVTSFSMANERELGPRAQRNRHRPSLPGRTITPNPPSQPFDAPYQRLACAMNIPAPWPTAQAEIGVVVSRKPERSHEDALSDSSLEHTAPRHFDGACKGETNPRDVRCVRLDVCDLRDREFLCRGQVFLADIACPLARICDTSGRLR